MKLIKPSFKIESKIDGLKILRNLELYGRVCYKSEKRITTTSASVFVNNILDSGHESVIEHESITVRIICDRGVSHEIVRHRLASYSQESTRYCNYSKAKHNKNVTFIIPKWCVGINPRTYNRMEGFPSTTVTELIWFNAMMKAESSYMNLLEQGWTAQMARSVLPNSLKTEIIITYNLREWRHFFKLRTSSNAHPQMREITIPLLTKLKKLIPVIFDGI